MHAPKPQGLKRQLCTLAMQAWALMDVEDGDTEMARERFATALSLNSKDLYSLQVCSPFAIRTGCAIFDVAIRCTEDLHPPTL